MRQVASRRNLIEAAGEVFKPPVFKRNASPWSRLTDVARRYFDLQAGSIWSDLRFELATVTGTLLDVGCGAQIYRSLLPKNVMYRGIDTLDAKAFFGYEVPDTFYFKGHDWEVAADSIETVLCTEVMEHVEMPAALLAQISGCLRQGGRLVLTVPFAARWHFVPYDHWRFTPTTLHRLLSQAGFVDIRVAARGNPLTVACYKVMALPLSLLFGGHGSGLLALTLGLLLSPIAVVGAVVGNLSFWWDWGEDCLGYTVIATKRLPPLSNAASEA